MGSWSELQCVKKYLVILEEVCGLHIYVAIYIYIYKGPLKDAELWGNTLFFGAVKFMTFKVPQAYCLVITAHFSLALHIYKKIYKSF